MVELLFESEGKSSFEDMVREYIIETPGGSLPVKGQFDIKVK